MFWSLEFFDLPMTIFTLIVNEKTLLKYSDIIISGVCATMVLYHIDLKINYKKD